MSTPQIHASVIRGEDGAQDLFTTVSYPSSQHSFAAQWLQAIWMFSADIEFTPCGQETGINYVARYEDYVKRTREGLRKQDSWALELFKYWDSILFPHADDSLGQSAEGDHAAADAERDEVDAAFNVSGGPSPSVSGIVSRSAYLRRYST
ncbi:hypothetical protein R3P38DRAFT_2966434 [Favolaschia claudopus]|uniref:Uncharacterized protein n=1 Tax=Favolaschia claudopus TaxID=2862362 RepID=A0AAW0B401_9AGAR